MKKFQWWMNHIAGWVTVNGVLYVENAWTNLPTTIWSLASELPAYGA